jgi:hypothetical protein
LASGNSRPWERPAPIPADRCQRALPEGSRAPPWQPTGVLPADVDTPLASGRRGARAWRPARPDSRCIRLPPPLVPTVAGQSGRPRSAGLSYAGASYRSGRSDSPMRPAGLHAHVTAAGIERRPESLYATDTCCSRRRAERRRITVLPARRDRKSHGAARPVNQRRAVIVSGLSVSEPATASRRATRARSTRQSQHSIGSPRGFAPTGKRVSP